MCKLVTKSGKTQLKQILWQQSRDDRDDIFQRYAFFLEASILSALSVEL